MLIRWLNGFCALIFWGVVLITALSGGMVVALLLIIARAVSSPKSEVMEFEIVEVPEEPAEEPQPARTHHSGLKVHDGGAE